MKLLLGYLGIFKGKSWPFGWLESIFGQISLQKISLIGGDTSSKGKNPVGKMLFEANMRRLDNLGYRTGYRTVV